MKLDDNKIADREIYLTRMQQSVLDKIFFIDKVFEPFSCILDFGCANGGLIKTLMDICPGYRYGGYDIDKDMIAAAKENVLGVDFWSSWEDITLPFEDTLINISSTLHEVYSYGTDADVKEFWDRVFGSGFRYITIRDMMHSEEQERPADKDMLRLVRAGDYTRQLGDFESVWGSITTQKQLVHFLLKYRYTQNWEREVREDYFPISSERLMTLIPDSYRVIFCERFTLPYTAWQLRKDLGIELKDHTHIKLILERK
ncbi:MAG: class I SAM-dependent methyltransferase [Ruminococcus sp.]|nr:class I SAM-dependent methyltransferase [Ruminococcus sp.]